MRMVVLPGAGNGIAWRTLPAGSAMRGSVPPDVLKRRMAWTTSYQLTSFDSSV